MAKKSMTKENQSGLFWKTLKELRDNIDSDGMVFGGMLIEAGIAYVMLEEKIKTKAAAMSWIREIVSLNAKRYNHLETMRQEKKIRDAT